MSTTPDADLPAAKRPGPPRRHLFVVAYARSGSTLTQGVLNTLPRTLVRGENGFFLLPLFRAHQGLRTFAEKFDGPSSTTPASAFYGLQEIDLAAFAASVRDLTDRQLLGATPSGEVDLLGFKEVLWHRVKPEEWADFFAFLDDAFGSPLYVLNRRDVAMAATSGFWRKNPENARQRITRIRELQDFLLATRADRCFVTEFEQITSRDRRVAAEHLRALARFVAADCDDDQLAAMLATLDIGHGPHPFGEARGPYESA